MLISENELCRVIGRIRMLRLHARMPAEKIYIPATWNPDNPALRIMGKRAAKLAVARFPACEVHIGTTRILAMRNRVILELADRGTPCERIAELLEISPRTARFVVRAMRQ